MSNVIAVVWDFDKTLIDGYMQDPIFADNDVDPVQFWKEVNALPGEYEKQGVLVNPETIYLNQFIRYAKEGKFKGLTNRKLESYGQRQRFYPGVPEIFQRTSGLLNGNSEYSAYGIVLEHYIVSTGMRRIIMGSPVAQFVKKIWGCELIEGLDKDGCPCISEIGYTIDNTSKTRALFEINKGDGVNVNASIPEEARRVHFINMVYVADGPSDVPAFSIVNKRGGATFAIYPKGNKEAFKQVEKMREQGRIQMFAEADYSEGTTADMWIQAKILEFADRIVAEEKEKIARYAMAGVPRHLTEG